MPPTKVIFLDIDGVICNLRNNLEQAENYGLHCQLDPVAINLINRLCFKTGAKVVISSSWASFHGLGATRLALEVAGMQNKYFHKDGMTPRESSDRGQQILDWLAKHPEIENFCILDDDNFDIRPYEKCEPYFVQTDGEEGLLLKDYKKCLKLLGSEDDL